MLEIPQKAHLDAVKDGQDAAIVNRQCNRPDMSRQIHDISAEKGRASIDCSSRLTDSAVLERRKATQLVTLHNAAEKDCRATNVRNR